MKEISDIMRNERFPSPCNQVTKHQSEIGYYLTSAPEESKLFPGIGRKLNNRTDWAKITVEFKDRFIKEIHQYRSYTVQSLIGNAGGYVGLFIGTAAYDIPSLLTVAYSKFGKFF